MSPLWPQRTGISEYSETLLPELSKKFDITLLVNECKVASSSLKSLCRIETYKEDEKYTQYDFILYNFGNNPQYHAYMYKMISCNPGFVILHDYSLFFLAIGIYLSQGTVLQQIYRLEGSQGIRKVKNEIVKSNTNDLLQIKSLSPILPMNGDVLKFAKGLLVHSKYAKEKILEKRKSTNVCVMNMLCQQENTDSIKADSEILPRIKYNIPKQAFLIMSLGFIDKSKSNEMVCKVVKQYNRDSENKIYYLMVGEGDYVDAYLDEYIKKTGFVDNEEFYACIRDADLVFNLRSVYNGESSGPLIQCMSQGKICCVSNLGWFGELPDNCVIKLSTVANIDELMKIINKTKNHYYDYIGYEASHYANDECNASVISDMIAKFLMRT